MGRLIDADLLKECYAGTNALDGKADYMSIRKMIDNQPTAYDVEKVVAELKKEKEIHTNHYNISIYKDFPEIKQRYKQICGVIDKSIDIVRKGGVE